MSVTALFEDGSLILRIPLRLEFWDSAALTPEQAGLLGRELEVFDLLRKNTANKEIAKRLGLEVRTVKFHVTNVLHKLGCESRAEVIYKYGHFAGN
jgi:DNA-binding NarL/FixJ family response regulator